MAYSTIGWLNDQAPSINQTNLNHMDNGIVANDSEIMALKDKLAETPYYLEMEHGNIVSGYNSSGNAYIRSKFYYAGKGSTLTITPAIFGLTGMYVYFYDDASTNYYKGAAGISNCSVGNTRVYTFTRDTYFRFKAQKSGGSAISDEEVLASDTWFSLTGMMSVVKQSAEDGEKKDITHDFEIEQLTKNVINGSLYKFGTVKFKAGSPDSRTIFDGFYVTRGKVYTCYVKSDVLAESGNTCRFGLGSNGSVTLTDQQLLDGYVWYNYVDTSASSRLFLNVASSTKDVNVTAFIYEGMLVEDELAYVRKIVETGQNELTYKDFTQGTFTSTKITSSQNYIRVKRMIKMRAGDELYLDIGALEYAIWFCREDDYYAGGSNLIAWSDWLSAKVYRAAQDGYAMLVLRRANVSSISPSDFTGTIYFNGQLALVKEQLNTKISGDGFEQGNYSGNGYLSSSTRLRLKYPFFAHKGMSIEGKCDGLNFYVWVHKECKFNGSGISEYSGWRPSGENYTLNHSGWVMITIRNNSDTNVTVEDLENAEFFINFANTQKANEKIRTKKYDITDLENGGYETANGKVNNTKRIRMKDLVFVQKGTKVNFAIGELYNMIWELSVDNPNIGNVVIAADGWSQRTTYEVKNDCWLMIAFATASTSYAASVINVNDFGDSYFQLLEGGAASLNNLVDDYFFRFDDELNQKVIDYAALFKTQNDIESFMFFTDSHFCGYTNWKDSLRKALLTLGAIYKSAPMDFCIYGGDVFTGTSPYNSRITSDMAMYYLTYQDQLSRENFGFDRYLPMVGNHDYNYQANDLLTEEDLVNAMFRKWGKAYYSYKGNNTMIYVLNTGLNKTNGGQGSYRVPMDDYKWEQIDWLANELIRDDSDHSIIAMHIIRNNDSGQPEFSLFTNANELAAAYNEHTTITLNNITYDFTGCTGRVEMFLGGHLHGDNFNLMKNGIPCIMRSNTTHNSVNPTADMIFCDWDNRQVTFKKIGDGADLIVDLDNYDPSANTVQSAVNNE